MIWTDAEPWGKVRVGTYFSLRSTTRLVFVRSLAIDCQAVKREQIQDILMRNKYLILTSFNENYPECRTLIVSLDLFNRHIGNIECIYILDFFKMLWKEGL